MLLIGRQPYFTLPAQIYSTFYIIEIEKQKKTYLNSILISVLCHSYSSTPPSGVYSQHNEYPRHIRTGNSAVEPIVEDLEQALHGLSPLGLDVTQVTGQLGPGECFDGSLEFVGIPPTSPSGINCCRQ